MKRPIISLFVLLFTFGTTSYVNAQVKATNPLIWADVPDPDVIRVGDTYYMSSTTMHMSPGVPIMKSKNLVNWKIVRYAYDKLASSDALNLLNGSNAYGHGSWASCIRYNNGIYYVATFSYTTNMTYIYTTTDIENGTWTTHTLSGAYHDLSLLFDNGHTYLIHGSNTIKIIELTANAFSVKTGGLNKTIISNASSVAGTTFYVQAEGSHFYKINGKYYLFLISWPNPGVRSELVYRADTITGPYTGKVVLAQGIAQGGIVDTPDGKWYSMLFKDCGSVGRIPYLVPVTWTDNWPVFGTSGKVPTTLDINTDSVSMAGIVESDNFDYTVDNSKLKLIWQWNHNPDNTGWSVTDRPGYFRLTTKRTNTNFLNTRNELTQRTYGPTCSGNIKMDVSNMKDGDYAGLGALQSTYGFIGVKMLNGIKTIIMMNSGTEAASISLGQSEVYFRIDLDFRSQTDKAYFSYSLDNINWYRLGATIQMSYSLTQFMGYRFAIFNYATKTAGGYVDVDWFKLGTFKVLPLSTGLNNVRGQETDIKIFPNPNNRNGFHVSSGFPISTVSVYDITSKLIRSENIGGEYEADINLSLKSGIYIVKTNTVNGLSDEKKISVK